MVHAMAVLGYRGPTSLSVASNYWSVLAELAAEKDAEFAITYDRELRHHLKSEVVAATDVAPSSTPSTTHALHPCSAISITRRPRRPRRHAGLLRQLVAKGVERGATTARRVVNAAATTTAAKTTTAIAWQ